MRTPAEADLTTRLEANTIRDDRSGCLVWIGRRDKDGYGQISVCGRPMRAHRVAWVLANGPIPRGLCVLHSCDNPPCVNVREGHLFLGTNTENMADRDAKGRQAKGLRNGAFTHPERLARGDRNASRLHPERRPKGESVKTSKLKTEEVVEIRSLALSGLSQSAIGRRFGVKQAAISKIVLLQSWRHVPASIACPAEEAPRG